MRKAAAILTCLLLLLAVGVAYNQCFQGPGGQAPPCAGSCPMPGASCAGCPNASAACPIRSACAGCDAGNCALLECSKVATLAGTVRYVRATSDAARIANGDQSLLLRIRPGCPKASVLQAKLAALARGDAVSATYRTCPKSGRHYLVDVTGGATAAESAATTSCGAAPVTCPASGGCGGCGGQ